jgi:outer membrane receptor protein involved in Fe transport
MNYQGGYEDNDSVPRRRLSPWTTWNLNVEYRLGIMTRSFGKDTYITASANNLFNQNPPFLNNNLEQLGFDEENGTLIGRRISLRVLTKW